MTVTVAVAQIASDPMATAAIAAATLRTGAGEGPKLAVFPDALLGGYPKGASFGAPNGMRKPEGRAAAIDLDGAKVAHFAKAAADTRAFAVVGVIERDGATLYCSVLYFDGAKGLVGKHRKLMPTAAERLIWGFGDGSTLPVFKTDFDTIGAVICRENVMAALRMHMDHQGVSLYFAPTADDRDIWVSSMQHIAMEGRTFVLTACQHISRAAYGPDHEGALGDDPATVMMRGGSAIIGQVHAGPTFSGETVLYTTIYPADIMRARFDFDVTDHYARPDVFCLSVDTQPKHAVKEV